MVEDESWLLDVYINVLCLDYGLKPKLAWLKFSEYLWYEEIRGEMKKRNILESTILST